MEVTSLNQVDAIRQRGIFKISRLQSKQRRQDQDQFVRFVIIASVLVFNMSILLISLVNTCGLTLCIYIFKNSIDLMFHTWNPSS